jgi:hypothetical protein
LEHATTHLDEQRKVVALKVQMLEQVNKELTERCEGLKKEKDSILSVA